MELTNEFNVNVPVDEAWAVLTDVERIAPCLPGAELQEIAGDEYRGVVKVKVGPITAQYKGTARFLELDDTAHRAVLRAEGRETRGQGNASATITATLVPIGGVTQVSVVTDLTVAGKVAQFGRGVLAEVSNKLMSQFAESLETTVLQAPAAAGAPVSADGTTTTIRATGPIEGAGSEAAAPETMSEATSGPARMSQESAPTASVDLLKVVGPSLVKRALPVLAAAGAFAVVACIRRRRRRR